MIPNSLFPLALVLAAPAAIAQCALPSPGAMIASPTDGWTSAHPIGFAFPFAGNVYTEVYISDHALVALHNAGVPPVPASGSFVWAPSANKLVGHAGPLIAPYWSDHTDGTSGTLWIDNTSGTHCTITWLDHETYSNQQPPFTVQMTLFADGRIRFCLDDRVDNQGSSFALNAIVGMSEGGQVVPPPQSDLSTGPSTILNTIYEEFTTVAASTPNPLFDVADTLLEFEPSFPGWGCAVTNPICAAKETYGFGCDTVALDSNRPVIGTSWDMTTTIVTPPLVPFAFTMIGLTRVEPGVPLPLIGIDSPGCSAYVDDIVVTLTAPFFGGTAVVTVPLPNDPSLKGAVLVAQSIAITATYPSNISTSNGLEGTIGY